MEVTTPQEPPTVEKPGSDMGGSRWGSGALEMMKDRASIAKNHITPQIQSMREKTSKRFEKYQPSIDRVKSSASAAANIGLEKVQPAFSRVKEGSTQGWSLFKNKTAPIAGRIQTMGMHVVSDILGDAVVEVDCVDDPVATMAQFVEVYRTNGQETKTLNTRIPTLIRTISNRSSSSSRSNSAAGPASPGDQCFANRYILCKILVFSGEVQVLGRMCAVNHSCRSLVQGEKKLWRFFARYGHISQQMRFPFWEHVTGAVSIRENSELDFDTYLQMAISKGESTELIMTDVRRTYGRVAPHKRSNSDVDIEAEEELVSQLSDILHALSGRFPDVGYCQGMDYIAAHVLDHVKQSSHKRVSNSPENDGSENDPLMRRSRMCSAPATRVEVERAFWLLVSLFENYGLRQMFGPGLQKLHMHCFQFQRLIEIVYPKLAEHFDSEKVMVEMFIVGWLQTLFLYLNKLPSATLDRIWDIFLVENSWKIMLRVSLALLHRSEPYIMSKPIDEVMQFLNTFGGESKQLLDADGLLRDALRIKVTNSVLNKLQKQHTRRPDQRKRSIGR